MTKIYYRYAATQVPSICEKTTCSIWSTMYSDIEGRIDCAACVSKAQHVLAEAVPS